MLSSGKTEHIHPLFSSGDDYKVFQVFDHILKGIEQSIKNFSTIVICSRAQDFYELIVIHGEHKGRTETRISLNAQICTFVRIGHIHNNRSLT